MERTKQRTDEDELVSIISKVTELRKANPGLIRGVRDLGAEIEVIMPNGIIKVRHDANKRQCTWLQSQIRKMIGVA